jgi:hypothetical protein
MTKQSILRLLVLLLFVIQSQAIIFAQQKARLGINLTTNINQFYNIEPEIGIVFERKVSKHSGFETGINFRTYQNQFLIIINNQASYPLISEKYISIPLSYKFYSKIVNAGLGITYDYYRGWRQLGGSTEVTSYWPGDDYLLGIIGKIGKQISLGDKFILEPEIKFNLLVFPSQKHYLGFGLVTKVDLQKE